MELIDISAPLRADLPTWPDEPGLERRITADVTTGDPATVSVLRMGSHTGTHIDAPNHFLADAGGLEAVPLDALVGPAFVADLRGVDTVVTADDLDRAGVPTGTNRLLARTPNSGWSTKETEFREDYVAYDESAAAWCLERGVRLVGIDYLSIEPFGAAEHGHPVHHRLLSAGVVIVEGLDLAVVEPGSYDLIVLPPRIPAIDGAPARALLRRT